MDFIEKLAAEGTLTEDQALRANRTVQDIVEAAARDPEFRKEAMEKLASVGDFANAVKDHIKDLIIPMTATALLGAAITGGSTLARTGIEQAVGKKKKKDAFEEMMKSNPRLKNHSEEDIHKAFDSLYRFNPHYAKDPWVAGTFVNETLSQERLDVNTVNNLVAAKDKLTPKSTSAVDFFMKTMPAMERQTDRDHRMDRVGWAMDDQDRKRQLHDKKLKEGKGGDNE